MEDNSLIIIPTYNESENIELIINKILQLDDLNDILVVDDNSPDGTSK
jgi:dolichol-phosphate mannosyltransferase